MVRLFICSDDAASSRLCNPSNVLFACMMKHCLHKPHLLNLLARGTEYLQLLRTVSNKLDRKLKPSRVLPAPDFLPGATLLALRERALSETTMLQLGNKSDRMYNNNLSQTFR